MKEVRILRDKNERIKISILVGLLAVLITFGIFHFINIGKSIYSSVESTGNTAKILAVVGSIGITLSIFVCVWIFAFIVASIMFKYKSIEEFENEPIKLNKLDKKPNKKK